MGFLGFWVKAMTTLALLGTAAILSIAIGIPLGIFCARRQRFYSMIRPIMDFMQTMPAFVFMIPVIAFFGTCSKKCNYGYHKYKGWHCLHKIHYWSYH